MMSSRERWDLCGLIGQEIAGQATPADWDRLQSLLLDSPEARAYYYKTIAVHAELAWNGGAGAADGLARLRDDFAEVTAQPKRAPRQSGAFHTLKFSPRLAALCATLLLVGYFVGAAVYVMIRQAPTHSASSHLAAVADDGAAATVVAGDGGKRGTDSPVGIGPIQAGKPLEISAGVVELTLKKGVSLRVEGPAQWTIDGDNRATLRSGKLLASVPREAIGFTVTTPTATVVDLGTEFGVTVDERGGTRTRVFKGEVRLHTASPASTPAAPQGTASRRLTAGQAVAIDAAGNITPVEPEFASAEQFIRRAGKLPPMVDPPHAYSRAVLALEGLVGYWRLAEAEPGYARDEVRTTRPIAAAPAEMGRSPGDYREFWMADFRQPGALVGDKNCGVHFNGESYVEMADHPSLSGDWDGLTLAAWIKPEAQQPPSTGSLATIIGKWAFEVTGDEYCLAYRHDGRLLIAVGNGEKASKGEQGMYGAGNIRIAPDRFSFVVGTWEKATGRYRLYVNGQPDLAEGAQAEPHKLNNRSYVPVMIGGQRANNDRYFAGTIDEVCILERALTPEEVKHLYELSGQPEEKANEAKGN